MLGFPTISISKSWTGAVDRSSALAAMVDLTFVAAELALDDAGAGSINRRAANVETAEPRLGPRMLPCWLAAIKGSCSQPGSQLEHQ